MFSGPLLSRTIAALLALGAGVGVAGHAWAAPLTGSALSADMSVPNLFPLSALKSAIPDAAEAARKDPAAPQKCDARCAADADAAKTGALGVFGTVAGRFQTDATGAATGPAFTPRTASGPARRGQEWSLMNAFPLAANEDGTVRWQSAGASTVPIATLPGSVTHTGPVVPSLGEGGLYLSSTPAASSRANGYEIPTTGLGTAGTVVAPLVGGGMALPNLATQVKSGHALSVAFVEAGALNRTEALTSSAMAPHPAARDGVEDILADSIGGAAVTQNIALAAAIPSSTRFGGDLDRLTKVLFGMVLEPATLSLFGLGLGAAAFLGRRRRS